MIGKIYKIVSSQTDKIYIGSTIQKLSLRFSEHKSDFKHGKKISSSFLLCYDDAKIVLIENYECEDMDELRFREREWIEFFTDKCVNKLLPIISEAERKIYQANYHLEISQTDEWKEQKKSYHKSYRQTEKYQEYIKNYHVLRYKKFNCYCGGKYTFEHADRHRKSKKHINAIPPKIVFEE